MRPVSRLELGRAIASAEAYNERKSLIASMTMVWGIACKIFVCMIQVHGVQTI